MNNVLDTKLAELRSMNYQDLKSLKDCTSEKIVNNRKCSTLTVWKDQLDSGEIRIVVQMYKHVFLGVGKMRAEGFKMSSTNHIFQLTKDELYEFI